ncbi:ribonuclease H-like domain-containing protein [Tanacetum coccineum]
MWIMRSYYRKDFTIRFIIEHLRFYIQDLQRSLKTQKQSWNADTSLDDHEMKLTEHYRMYAEVFEDDVSLLLIHSQTESTHGTHRTTSAPRRSKRLCYNPPSLVPKRVHKANELFTRNIYKVSLAEHKSHEEQKQRKIGTDKEAEITKETPMVEITNVVIPMNVNDDDDEITNEVTFMVTCFAHLWASVHCQESHSIPADNFHDVMVRHYPYVDKNIKARLMKQYPEQVLESSSIVCCGRVDLEPDNKNLNKNDIEDIVLVDYNIKVLGLCRYKIAKVFNRYSTRSSSEYGKSLLHGIIYKNSKKEKRVMRHSEIHKFCDATLNRVLEGLKSYNNDVKYGYVQKDLTKEEAEYLKLFEEEIEERLKHRRQMRRWEIPSFEQNKPSYAKINFVKSDENTRKSVIEQHTNRQAKNLRKSQSPRVDKRNWNGLMTQKLGDGFEFNKKSCFVCGNLNHLIKDYNFYENKMVGKSMLNNMGRVTGQMEVRPVWNNAQRVNHQNILTHPYPKRYFVPTVVLTKSDNVSINTAKQSSSRATISNSTARYFNTAASKPTVNGAKPSLNVSHKSHSSVKRTIYQRTTPKNSDFKEKVNTAKGNPQYALQINVIFDSGCSRHMTRNKSYLTDYQDIDGGFLHLLEVLKEGVVQNGSLILTPLDKFYNYEHFTAGINNGDAGIETNVNAGQAGQEKASDHKYILLPLMLSNSPLSSNTGILMMPMIVNEDVGAEADLNNLEITMNVSPIPTTRIHKDHPKDQIIGDINSSTQTRRMTKITEEHAMVWTLVDLPKGKRAIGTKWVYRNKKDERGIIVRNKARLVAQGYTQEKGINYDNVFAPIARIEAIRLFLAYTSFMGFIVYQMDVKSTFLYGTIEEEVYVCQPLGFKDL